MTADNELNVNIHIYFHHDGEAGNEGPSPAAAPLAFDRQRLASELQSAIEKAQLSKSDKTTANYATAVRSLLKFLAEHEVSDGLTAETISQYQHWLRAKGLSLNTVSCYMRSLRSLANSFLPTIEHIFDRAFTGNIRTEKRAIHENEVLRLQQLTLVPGSYQAFARDLFLFSFYAQGMPFVDMAHLQTSHISNGHISYMRHKTGQRISIRIEDCMQDIIDRYHCPDSTFVFPILSSDRQYDKQLNRYNRTLKRLAEKAGIKSNITSYVARHTWASIAYQSSVELSVISKALGHTNPQTTLVYIKDINDDKLEAANHNILKTFQ